MLEDSKLYQPTESDAESGIPRRWHIRNAPGGKRCWRTPNSTSRRSRTPKGGLVCHWEQETYWEERDIALKGAAKRGPWAEDCCGHAVTMDAVRGYLLSSPSMPSIV